MKTHFSKKLSLAAILTLFAITAGAQETPCWKAGEQSLDMYLCNARPYIVPDVEYTPAPKGFKPFYISYFGRHGSRYPLGGSTLARMTAAFDEAQASGMLTETGLALKRDLETARSAQLGRSGYLSIIGARELDGIGRRLAARYKPVFTDRKRPVVNATSNIVPRCIVTMAYVTKAVQTAYPGLDVLVASDEVVRKSIIAEENNEEARKEARKLKKAAMAELDSRLPEPDSLFIRIFKNPAEAASKWNQRDFVNDLFYCGIYTYNSLLDMDLLLKYLSASELKSAFIHKNADAYYNYGPAADSKGIVISYAKPILRGVLDDAAAAVAGNDRCADMRFGHDSGTVPFVGLLGLSGAGQQYSITDPDMPYCTSENICMACNVQFVFYRNSRDEVLVKVLFNEIERTIDGLESVNGCYYRWEEFKTLMESKL